MGLGALLVGYYDDRQQLLHAGKVGTGFTNQLLRQLHQDLRARELPNSPFADLVREKGAHWARPELVGEVAFSEWTGDGRLRHPSFQGLRPDKTAAEVRRETHRDVVYREGADDQRKGKKASSASDRRGKRGGPTGSGRDVRSGPQ